MTVPGVPFLLTPSPVEAWAVDEATATVTATAAARTDIFIDPGDSASMLDAATLLGIPPDGDFQFSARVTVGFRSTFDAGVLLLWIDDRHWGKLCFEYSPDGETMVVSVVARGVADDANAFAVDGSPASIGFEAQSPTGDGCAVTFDEIRFTGERLRDLRDGS